MTVLDLLETHPQAPQCDRRLVARCVEACAECATACTICAGADLVESDAADMVRCVRLDLDCADVCIATGRIVARQTASEPAIVRSTLEACRTACRSCAEECERVSNGSISLAHGWSSARTSALSEYVLGIRPVTPGFKRWSVSPHPGDLRWAKGQVPTPHRPIAVRRRRRHGHLWLWVSAPRGTSGTVSVPASSTATVRVNGRIVRWRLPPRPRG